MRSNAGTVLGPLPGQPGNLPNICNAPGAEPKVMVPSPDDFSVSETSVIVLRFKDVTLWVNTPEVITTLCDVTA